MPIEALLAALEADTEARVAAIRAEGLAEAARLRGEEAQVESERRAEQDRAWAESLERDLEPRRHAVRRKVLEARQRLLDRVFRSALDALVAAEVAPEHREALAGALEEALVCVSGPAVVRCRPEVAEVVRDLAGDRPIRVEAVADAPPGLVVEAEDGSVRVDATLAARLAELRPLVARDLLAAVGGGP